MSKARFKIYALLIVVMQTFAGLIHCY